MQHTQAIEKNIEYLPVMYLTKTMKGLYQKGKKITGGQHPTVLIMGERGTGKELLAKSIHYNASPFLPFITINCVNLPINHFEEKLSTCLTTFAEFTASASGFENGTATLFLRDVGRLKHDVQKELFQLLKLRIFETAAGAPGRKQKITLMFSYDANSQPAGHEKLFDPPTYKAFNPFMLSVLPLRERLEDIQPLAHFFVDKFSKEYDKDIGGLHSATLKLLESYPWPGNVSELRDVMENAVLLCQSPLITKEDIRFNISKKSIALESFLSREDFFSLEELERIYIQTVLRRVKNNKSKAAKILNISRNTLQRKIDLFIKKATKKKTAKKTAQQQPLLF